MAARMTGEDAGRYAIQYTIERACRVGGLLVDTRWDET
jgi:hypothetical protein